jgi:ribosome-associated translation inhibitor RaiA
MKTSISYRNVEAPELVEPVVERHLIKIATLLKVYDPDLVQIHGSYEKHPKHTEYSFSVNLSLPTGTLHATGSAPDAKTCTRKGFTELEAQIKKHQALLRKDFEWKRKRGRAGLAPAD